jgi:CelD/BcsL family acetyltransferase involved in cellulose biosynthesis
MPAKIILVKFARRIPAPSYMEFSLHRDFAEVPAPAWNALAASGISDTPFARHEYLRQWWRTRGGGEWTEAELMLVSGREEGQLVGVAPLFRARHEGREALLLVGSIEISDYLDLIVRQDDLARFLGGLLDFLADHGEAHALLLDWYNVPEASPTIAALQAEAHKRAWSFHQEVYRPTPRITLPGNFDTFLAGLEKKQRHEVRRKMRRAAEGPAVVRFHILEDPATLEAETTAFLELMAEDNNKAGFLRPAMREHMRAVIREAFGNGYLWLAFLSIDDVRVAAALNFDYRNKLWGYNSGVSHAHLELSPGWVLLAHQIEWACQHGRDEFDFMRGDEDYKYRFGAIDRHVLRVVAGAGQDSKQA